MNLNKNTLLAVALSTSLAACSSNPTNTEVAETTIKIENILTTDTSNCVICMQKSINEVWMNKVSYFSSYYDIWSSKDFVTKVKKFQCEWNKENTEDLLIVDGILWNNTYTRFDSTLNNQEEDND